MDTELFLEPDTRWTVWQCNTYQEYLNKFLIKGKFHSEVPETIKSSYEIVERLIAYSYFHYPMIEEVISKMTRIFEMAVRIRAKSLNIAYNNLSNCLNKMKDHPKIDPEMADDWFWLKGIRNFHAHPDSHSYSGPTPLNLLFTIVNIVNRLFSPKTFFSEVLERLAELQKRFNRYDDGIFILEIDDVKQLIISAKPYFLSPDYERSIWYLSPVYSDFPQKMEDFNNFNNPIILRLTDLKGEDKKVIGRELSNNSIIRIYDTDIKGIVIAAKKYKEKLESADDTVKSFHKNNSSYTEYLEKQKFIYDEFWN